MSAARPWMVRRTARSRDTRSSASEQARIHHEATTVHGVSQRPRATPPSSWPPWLRGESLLACGRRELTPRRPIDRRAEAKMGASLTAQPGSAQPRRVSWCGSRKPRRCRRCSPHRRAWLPRGQGSPRKPGRCVWSCSPSCSRWRDPGTPGGGWPVSRLANVATGQLTRPAASHMFDRRAMVDRRAMSDRVRRAGRAGRSNGRERPWLRCIASGRKSAPR